MNPILVYGFPLGSSLGLVTAFEWLGQPYALCRVDMLNEMKNADYARINARTETPVLIAGDTHIVTETVAIAQWLEHRDVNRKISFDPGTPQSDRMHQMIAFLNTGFTSAFSALWSVMESPTLDASAQKVLRDYGRDSVIERHDRLEQMLADMPYLAGDSPTLADAVFIGVARWLDFHDVAAPSRWPRIHALRKRLEGDAAVRFATAIELGELPIGMGAFAGHIALRDVIDRYGRTPA